MCQKNRNNPLFFFFTVSLLLLGAAGCSSSNSDINFDSEAWKSDLNGCNGQRLALKEQVEEVRLKIIGMKEREIRPLFGKPDAEELLERSNKIYIYYLTPGPKCKQKQLQGKTIALAVRFDALGSVKESNLITE